MTHMETGACHGLNYIEPGAIRAFCGVRQVRRQLNAVSDLEGAADPMAGVMRNGLLQLFEPPVTPTLLSDS